jgi:hypothetical protein
MEDTMLKSLSCKESAIVLHLVVFYRILANFSGTRSYMLNKG